MAYLFVGGRRLPRGSNNTGRSRRAFAVGSNAWCAGGELAARGAPKDLQVCQRIVRTKQEPLYLGAGQWLDHCADSRGEQSPHARHTVLPAVRKEFCCTIGIHHRAQHSHRAASIGVILDVWRADVT